MTWGRRARLEADGAVAPEWQHPESGPARKVYTLTASGKRRLEGAGAQWLAFVGRATDLLEDAMGDGRASKPVRIDQQGEP